MVNFDPYDKAFARDPYPVYKLLRDEAPVFYNEALKFWALSRYSDVMEAHKDYKTFSSAGGVTIEGYDAGQPILLATDPPVHRWHKSLITKVFTPQKMGALEPFIRNKVTSLLDQASKKPEFDFVQEFSLQIPLDVISELIGIPEERRRQIHDLTNSLLYRGEEAMDLEKMAAVMATTFGIYMELIEERRKQPRNDPITHLIQCEVQDDEGVVRRLEDHELCFRFAELAAAGHETVAKAIPNGAMAFQRFPSEREKARRNLQIMPRVVDEILRFDPPSQLQGRTTTRDVQLHGVTIPAGVKTMLLTGAATHDERKFKNPDIFDVSRDQPLETVFFGYGIHRCLGMHLARLEIRIVFEELFRRFPDFQVDADRATRTVLSNVRGVSTLPATLRA